MAKAGGTVARSEYVSKADLRKELGLTDSHFALLGPADMTEAGSEAGPAEAHRFYLRERVEQWIEENKELIEASHARRAAREAQRNREHEEAEARLLDVRDEIAEFLRQGWTREQPDPVEVADKLRRSLNPNGNPAVREAVERAIFAYVLENLTDYHRLVRMLNRSEAGFDLSAAARIYLCARVVRRYQLTLDPMEMAFPAGAKTTLPPVFSSGDPEKVAAEMLGIEV